MKALRVSASVLKILMGVMFIISASAKFFTIDVFEMYVYSFGLFPMTLTFYLARFVIVAELILGAALISHRNHRFTVLMSLLFLLFFIVFLTYAHFIGRTDNCNCFGDLIEFDPVQSILKNALLIVILLFVYKYAPSDWAPRWWLVLPIYIITSLGFLFYTAAVYRYIHTLSISLFIVMICVGLLASFRFYNRWYVTLVLLLAPLVAIFILTPPDSWFYKNSDERFDQQLFSSQILADTAVVADSTVVADTLLESGEPALLDVGLDQGRHIVTFFSPGCGFCKLAAGKITTIVSRSNMECDKIIYVFPLVPDTSRYEKFYTESKSSHFVEKRIDKNLFLKITRGAFPLVVLVDDGEVKASFAYRNIDEKKITDFMNGKEL